MFSEISEGAFIKVFTAAGTFDGFLNSFGAGVVNLTGPNNVRIAVRQSSVVAVILLPARVSA